MYLYKYLKKEFPMDLRREDSSKNKKKQNYFYFEKTYYLEFGFIFIFFTSINRFYIISKTYIFPIVK